ncbi:MAG: isocitrate lyase/phosphoenolpyruvate mutase family protein, partial [Actinomycetales bacterium]
RPHADVLADAIERGKAFLEAGAPVVFVPGAVSEDDIAAFVDAWGPQRLTLIGAPGSVPLARMAELGVARVSYGPFAQSVALMGLENLAKDVVAGGGLPSDFRMLN